jgi:hypothetical membrane protein
MHTPSSKQKILLTAAFLVPFIYFGAQFLAAPYFPNYSVFTTSASDLGSNLSSRPNILNIGALLTGILSFLGSAGLAMSLPRLGASKVAAFLLALSLASAGLAALWAGLHPLPHPQHNPGVLGFGMFVAPFAAVWTAWRMKNSKMIRFALVLNVIAFIVLGAIMSGVLNVDLAAFGGLIQKLLAASSFLPSSVLAGIALMRSRHHVSAA